MLKIKALALVLIATLCFPVVSSAAVVSGTVTVLVGGTTTLLGSSSPTACTNLEVNASGYLSSVTDGSGTGQTYAITFYDESTATCAQADQLYSAIIPQGQTIPLNFPLKHGLTYKISGAAINNIVIVRI
jgi:hypothetical protein